MTPFSTFVPSFLFKIISNICLRKKGGTSKKTKKGRIHHGIKIPCFLRQLINKINFVQTTLEVQLHLLINNAFLPVVDDRGVFQGLLTRREWIKAFNYILMAKEC
ncbi:CBS domain-containing protein [Lactobacillus helveticus]|nr:CBS domain-containing protein [Lactobacillus helveticus]